MRKRPGAPRAPRRPSWASMGPPLRGHKDPRPAAPDQEAWGVFWRTARACQARVVVREQAVGSFTGAGTGTGILDARGPRLPADAPAGGRPCMVLSPQRKRGSPASRGHDAEPGRRPAPRAHRPGGRPSQTQGACTASDAPSARFQEWPSASSRVCARAWPLGEGPLLRFRSVSSRDVSPDSPEELALGLWNLICRGSCPIQPGSWLAFCSPWGRLG